jgi:hypothetical protein
MQRGFQKESRKQSKGAFGSKESGYELDNIVEEVAWTTKEIGHVSTRHSQENLHSAIEERFVKSLKLWLFLTFIVSAMSKEENWFWNILFQGGKSDFEESR